MTSIKNVIATAAGKNAAVSFLKVQKHSPTILFGAGIVGVVGTVILASRATLRLSDLVDEASATIEKINVADNENEEYTPESAVKDKGVVYVKTAIEVSKLYAPALILGVVSVSCLAGSHNILTRRNAALGAAYAGMEKAFKEYRGRVVDEIGAEKEAKIFQPTEEVDAITPEGKKVKVAVPTGVGGSPYKKLFDESNANWNKENEYNFLFIQAQQNMANDLLTAKGYVFLNDVYEALGIPRTKAGQIVGWVADGKGDGFIDFGLRNTEDGLRFVAGEERSIWLDFNVDGNILNLI